jgi:hypothetical protein
MKKLLPIGLLIFATPTFGQTLPPLELAYRACLHHQNMRNGSTSGFTKGFEACSAIVSKWTAIQEKLQADEKANDLNAIKGQDQ